MVLMVRCWSVQQRRVNGCLDFTSKHIGSHSSPVCLDQQWFAGMCLKMQQSISGDFPPCHQMNCSATFLANYFHSNLLWRRIIFWFWSSRRMMQSEDFPCRKCPWDDGGMRVSVEKCTQSGETITYITNQHPQSQPNM